jgi:hypothetical protein
MASVQLSVTVVSPPRRLIRRAREKTLPPIARFCPSWPVACERILASVNNSWPPYAAGCVSSEKRACKLTSLTVKLSEPRSFSASTCSRTRRLESTLTGHSQSRRWESLLGGRRTSAFPVDAPSILRLRSVHLSRDARPRTRTRYLFERHRLLAAAVSACRCRWNGAVFLSNSRPSRECRIGGSGRDLVQTWDSSFYRLRIRHRSNTVCPDGRRSRRRSVEIRAGPPRLLAAQEL